MEKVGTFIVNNMKKQILAVLAVLFVVASAAYASPPTDMVVSNITTTTAFIALQTGLSSQVTINAGTTTSSMTITASDRLNNGTTHYFGLTGLTAGTTYYYQVISNGVTDNNNGNFYTFTTFASVGVGAPGKTYFGTVYQIGGTPTASNSIVHFQFYNGSAYSVTMSATLNASDSYSFLSANLKNAADGSAYSFAAGQTVYVTVLGGAFGELRTTFTTAAAPAVEQKNFTLLPDTQGPSFVERVPGTSSTNIPTNSDVSFRVTDNDVGVSLSTLYVQLGVTTAVSAGVQQPGYVLTTSSDGSGGFFVTINPTVDFAFGTSIQVSVNARDVSNNIGTANYSFTTAAGDTTPPVITALSPAASSTNVALNTNVSMNINDASSGVSLNTIRVTVNGTLVVNNGVAVGSPYPSTVVASGLGFNININPDVDFTSGSVVTVNVSASDISGNIASTTYTFTTTVGDITPPTVTAITPTSGSTNVAINTNVSMNITDGTGVSLNTIRVTINGTLAVNNGSAVGAPFPTTITASGLGFNIVINPDVDFANSAVITLQVSARDISGNITTTSYSFTTIAAGPVDTTPPTTNSHSPVRNATGVSNNTNLQFHITDAYSGVSQNSIVLTVSGNVVTPVITGTPSDYTVSYLLSGFSAGQTVNVSIAAQDISGNVMTADSYYVVLYSAPVSSNWIAPYPISVPTIFDPSISQTTTLMWPMVENVEVVMKIYDLNGQNIMQRRFLSGSNGATAGINNTYIWDGRDDLGRIQATGIYYFYIISAQAGQQKVLGRGNIIIRRTR